MSWLVRDALLRSKPNRALIQNIIHQDLKSLSVTERAVSAALYLNKWDEEIIPSYKPKAFYPAKLGETLNGAYKLITKIGFGTTSTVWLASDVRRWWWQRRYVALKISVNNRSPEFAGSEVAISKHISNSSIFHPGRLIVRTHIDTFSLQGPKGVHPVLVYDLMREPLSILRERCVGDKFEPDLVKRLLTCILTGLDYLHNHCHVVHGDLNTENVMIPMESRKDLYQFVSDGSVSPPERVGPNGRIVYLSQIAGRMDSGELRGLPKIIDFGASTLMGRDSTPTTQLTRHRAPELLLGAPFGYPTDIWNLGLMACTNMIAWELLEGQPLLETSDLPDGVRTEEIQLAEIIGLLGSPPKSFRTQGSKSDLFFESKGKFKFPELIPPPEKLKKRITSLEKKDRGLFLEFLRSMLVWDPAKRSSTRKLLDHPWLVVEKA